MHILVILSRYPIFKLTHYRNSGHYFVGRTLLSQHQHVATAGATPHPSCKINNHLQFASEISESKNVRGGLDVPERWTLQVNQHGGPQSIFRCWRLPIHLSPANASREYEEDYNRKNQQAGDPLIHRDETQIRNSE